MTHSEFQIGQEFWCGGKRWRCTDIGSRVVVAICLEPHEVATVENRDGEKRNFTDDPSWLNGPPYAVAEYVFDEYALAGCLLSAEEQTGIRET
jgi:hypothetical protein